MEGLTLITGIISFFGVGISAFYLLGKERVEKLKQYILYIFGGALSLIVGYIIITKYLVGLI